MSPYGFGGTRGAEGAPVWDDHAGSGGGTANRDFAAAIAAGDRGTEHPHSPAQRLPGLLRGGRLRPGGRGAAPGLGPVHADRRRALPRPVGAERALAGVAPGTTGMNNAISPAFFDVSDFAETRGVGPVTWVRGNRDAIVSDASLFDLGNLGALGAIPGLARRGGLPAPAHGRPDAGRPRPLRRERRAPTRRWCSRGWGTARTSRCPGSSAGCSPTSSPRRGTSSRTGPADGRTMGARPVVGSPSPRLAPPRSARPDPGGPPRRRLRAAPAQASSRRASPWPPPPHRATAARRTPSDGELVGGVDDEAGAGGADGVADGDAAAVGVDPGGVDAELGGGLGDDGAEGLVDLDEVEVAGVPALPLQRGLDGPGGLGVQGGVRAGDLPGGPHGGQHRPAPLARPPGGWSGPRRRRRRRSARRSRR